MSGSQQRMNTIRQRIRAERREQSDNEHLKTGAMYRLERKWSQDIEDLIAHASDMTGELLAHSLGISESCLSRWRKKLGIDA